MNITIKITHTNGTVMDISIPVAIEQPAQIVQQPASAVVTPEEVHVASEPAIPVADAPSGSPDDEQVSKDLIGEEALTFLRENIFGKERVGGDGEGDGRIGGMGERKEEVGEGAGGEENLEQFRCSDGFYAVPPNLYSDFCAAFGKTMVDHQLTLARLWVETNPPKRKTRRGMGRFLNAWMCRAQGEKRQPLKSRSGSLLEANNTSQQGW